MGRGSNLKGPFGDLPTKGRDKIIADIACSACGEPVPLRVNGHGHLFAYCKEDGCGHKVSASNMGAARRLILSARNWQAGAKKPAYVISGIIKPETELPPDSNLPEIDDDIDQVIDDFVESEMQGIEAQEASPDSETANEGKKPSGRKKSKMWFRKKDKANA
jgi:hypothetical protein